MRTIILILAFLLLPTTLVRAEPIVARADLFLLSLGKLDLSSETITADFWLTVNCDGECPKLTPEIIGGRIVSATPIVNTPTTRSWRVYATLQPKLDLRLFPFDRQRVEISLEDGQLGADALRLVPANTATGVDRDVRVVGWNIAGWTIAEHTSDYAGDTYSRLTFEVELEKPVLSAFLKTLLPLCFILAIMLSSYVMDTDKIKERIGMASAALTAAVMFHVAVGNQMPLTGYLTFADKCFIVVYTVTLGTVILNLRILQLQQAARADAATRLNTLGRNLVPIGVPVTVAPLLLLV